MSIVFKSLSNIINYNSPGLTTWKGYTAIQIKWYVVQNKKIW